MKYILFLCLGILPFLSFSQIDTSFIAKLKALDTANILRRDTLKVPEDGLTSKIRILRKQNRGLTTETIIQLKIHEEQEKDKTHPKEFYTKLLTEVTTGKTGKLIENSIINLYRRTFSEIEIDDLIKFYNTTAGMKMNKEHFLIMVESVKDSEQLLKLAAKNLQ